MIFKMRDGIRMFSKMNWVVLQINQITSGNKDIFLTTYNIYLLYK